MTCRYFKYQNQTNGKIVVLNVAKTESGYCVACDILPGWVVIVSGDFGTLEKEVQESIDFYVECAKTANEKNPPVFGVEYKFNIQSLLNFYQNIFSFAALQYITGIVQKLLRHFAAVYSKPRKPQADKIVAGLN